MLSGIEICGTPRKLCGRQASGRSGCSEAMSWTANQKQRGVRSWAYMPLVSAARGLFEQFEAHRKGHEVSSLMSFVACPVQGEGQSTFEKNF